MRAAREPALRGRRRLRLLPALLAGFAFAAGAPGPAARAQNLPYTIDEIVQIIAAGVVPDARIAALLTERCIAFRADAQAVARLREAGAGPEVLRAVRTACRILPGEPKALAIEPDTVALRVGERLALTARGAAPDGRRLDGVAVRWSSEDPGVASVDDGGRVHAVGAGMTGVTARATNDVRATVRVWVQPNASALEISPRTALLVGLLVPGAGQFYTAQPGKGLLVFGGVTGALAAGVAVTDGGDRPLLVPGVLVAAGLWTYGAADARRRARRLGSTASAGPAWAALGSPEPAAEGGVRLPLLTLRY